jgi:hypothetical protein
MSVYRDLGVSAVIGEAVTEPAIIARYTRWLEQLREAAITGNAAAEPCRQIANTEVERPQC